MKCTCLIETRSKYLGGEIWKRYIKNTWSGSEASSCMHMGYKLVYNKHDDGIVHATTQNMIIFGDAVDVPAMWRADLKVRK